eukprot:TRINITY_DN16622_c0_g1_i1.p1 TRINITY_DN16622_c0_g1~~TRINITY_DN16622_c0_g1_i1.p1  ORF type:complete len:504 (-),score=221.28 TRINITY_DN16622_c0_g1_i1:23-1534(-)
MSNNNNNSEFEFPQINNFINGEFVNPVNDEWIDNYDPSIGKVVSKIANSTKEDVDVAVEAAKEAFKSWSKKSPQERSIVMNRIADLIEERLDEFALAESKDQGKPFSLAKMIDIPRAVSNFRFFAGAILHHEDMSTTISGPPLSAVNYTVSQPVGVAGLISPWNLPLYLLTWKIAPCIACGNTCVAKPSEMTSVTAYMLGQVCNEAGLPNGVVNLVFGTGPSAGQPLVEHPDVPLISFTGGTKTGTIIQKTVAPLCKKISLELGGKNANIIFADANLDEAISVSVSSSFANQGEICLCGSRIFVEESIYDEFLEKFRTKVSKVLTVGDPRDSNTTTGALISQQHMEKVLSYIELAKEEGGEIILGGQRKEDLEGDFKNGYFVNPTIIIGLHPISSRVQQEEIFGPVVTVYPFKTEEEVLCYVNSVEYGLSSSVWTQNLERGHRISLAIHAGTVWVNCWLLRDLRVPFGGVKHSGIGREGGKYSLDFFTEQKTICMKYNPVFSS